MRLARLLGEAQIGEIRRVDPPGQVVRPSGDFEPAGNWFDVPDLRNLSRINILASQRSVAALLASILAVKSMSSESAGGYPRMIGSYERVGSGIYAGVVRLEENGNVVWRCGHEHENFGQAVQCARARLRVIEGEQIRQQAERDDDQPD